MKSFLDILKKYFESLLENNILTTEQLADGISLEKLNIRGVEYGELKIALIGIINGAYHTNKYRSNLEISSITFKKFGEKVDVIINSNIPGENIIVTNRKDKKEHSTQYSPEEFEEKLLEQFNNIFLKNCSNDQREFVEAYLAKIKGLLLSGVSNNLNNMARKLSGNKVKSFFSILKKYFESLLERNILTTEQLKSGFLEISPKELNFKGIENIEFQNALIGIIKEAYPTYENECMDVNKDSNIIPTITFVENGPKVDVIINSNIPGKKIIVTNMKDEKEPSTQYSPEEFEEKLLEQFKNIFLKNCSNDQREFVEAYLEKIEGRLLSGVSNNLNYMVIGIIKYFEECYKNAKKIEDNQNDPKVQKRVNTREVDRKVDPKVSGDGSNNSKSNKRKNNEIPKDRRHNCLMNLLNDSKGDFLVNGRVKYKWGNSEFYNAYIYNTSDGVCIVFEPFAGNLSTRIKCLAKGDLDVLLDKLGVQEKNDTFWEELVRHYMGMSQREFNLQGNCTILNHGDANNYINTIRGIVRHFQGDDSVERWGKSS